MRRAIMKQLTMGLWGVLLVLGLVLGLSSMAFAKGWNWGLHGSERGSGVEATDARSVKGFSQVRSLGSIDVEYTSAAQHRVIVHGDDNLLAFVKTELDGDTLVIATDRNLRPKQRVWVEVASPALDRIQLRGSGDFDGDDIDTEQLSIAISGSGDVQVDGAATALKVKVNGSGDVHAAQLESRTASVSISGSGDVDVRVSDNLNVNISGSGDVTYSGTPTVSQRIMGSGELQPAAAQH